MVYRGTSKLALIQASQLEITLLYLVPKWEQHLLKLGLETRH